MAAAAVLCTFSLSDEALAMRAAAGETSAFSELVARYQDRIYRFVLRMAHDVFDAEEIAQETFLLAYRGIASFHGESRFRTWLYRVAFNQMLMRRRAMKRRQTQSLEVVAPQANDQGIAAAGVDGDLPRGVDELVDGKRLTERVRQAIACLDEPYRTALVLRDLEELSAEDTAEILGVSSDAVRQRAHRARLQLRSLLHDLIS